MKILLNKDRYKSALESFKMSIFALLFALIVGACVIAACGYSPIMVYSAIFTGSFGTAKGFVLALTQATPLMYTGLAFAIAYKVRMINTGAEGQLHLGAMAAALVGIYVVGIPSIIHIPLALFASAAAGFLAALFVAWLKIRFNAHELITTLMLNNVFMLFTSYLCNGPFLEEGAMITQTKPIEPTARLLRLASRSQLTIALFIVIAIAILFYIIFTKTALGYEMQVTGLNLKSAKTAGIQVNKVYMITFALSGAVAALCGASFALGVNGRFLEGFSNGSGFAGISVAALAAYNPIGVVFSAVLFGGLKAGAMTLNRTSMVPIEIVDVIQATVVVFVAAPKLVRAILDSGKIFKKKSNKNTNAVSAGGEAK